MIFWIVLGLYLAIAIATPAMLRTSGDSAFEGDDISTYMFRGFIGLCWGIFLLPYVIGLLSSRCKRK